MQYRRMSLACRLKRALLGEGRFIPEDLSEFLGLERVYRSPPLTEEHVSAIRLIAPFCAFERPSDRYRDLWDQIQNASCWSELRALQPVFDALPRPRRILEIGPGLGRSLVFFTKKLSWRDADIHAYEGNGGDTKYTKLGPRFEDSFCGNLGILRRVLEYNGIENVIIHDANAASLDALPGPFDLIYSFYSVGFHWSLEHFLDDILALLSVDGTAIFTVPPNFETFPRLDEQFYERVPLFPNARKANRRNELLLLRKAPFPACRRLRCATGASVETACGADTRASRDSYGV
jgi:Methyltransferase domain